MHSAPLWLMKPTLPRRAMVVAKVAFKPLIGTHYTQAVRSDDSHIAAAGMLQNLAFQLCTFSPHLFEAGGDNDGAFYAKVNRVLDDARDGRSWRDNNDQIHNFGNS